MTQMLEAMKGNITDAMKAVAADEKLDPEYIRKMVAKGYIAIPDNNQRETVAVGIGENLRTKVNATIGTSTDINDLDMELEKAKIAEEAGADTLMELSIGGDLDNIRRTVLKNTDKPVGSVPIYQTAVEAIEKDGSAITMDPDDMLKNIEKQAKDGIDFMAIHCSVNRETLKRLKRQGRKGGLVSRGGSFISSWMVHNDCENPLYENYDQVLDIVEEYDVCLSMANAMRAGALTDSTDRAQIQELIVLGELVDRARERGVQTIVEGPGHIPINEIETNINIQKKMCRNAPFYMLGPIVTDIAPAYDHIVSAIGAAQCARYGANFICYVTPAEHLALPGPEDVREGVIATRIGAHAGDLAIDLERFGEEDILMADARKELNWEEQYKHALWPEDARAIRDKRPPEADDTCTMCGNYCAIKIVNQWLDKADKDAFDN
ncbi:MAG: phosphomethylpyrimidine synthase [Methanosphaera sp.]|uniref:phosphomethylpyrimidine synthase n=1 Tax=Methanosphaera sp. TaxID=2666342 RepID=UPI002600D659|nr:phosphomethylpyrimidine synthase [Methanosphaera sp.]MCI5867545.1 phosphomethylpyrimidine synthase [Methanosphaera sp.]MDD6534012.1 phosphomethylpyrimidine synthase [Methanosphaera sp.]MDY3956178.1 phosphomethylpyrimidine synthase [Methanosphaera sp.]